MISRTQLATICETLEAKLQQLGFVPLDTQFDAVRETLCLVLDNEPHEELPRLTHGSPLNGATIDARLLWKVMRDLIKLGVMNPALQLRMANRDQPKTGQVLGRS